MPTRRKFLLLGSALILGAALPVGAARADARSDTATSFIQHTADQLLAIVNGPQSLAEKQRALTPIIDQAVDVNAIARFCLGRFWRQASAQQQNDYLNLFHAVLVNSITGKLGDYNGVKIAIGKARPTDDGVLISSVITRPNNAPNAVDWLVLNDTGSLKIGDMIAEGTSLRLTQRSDYASYLSHNNNDVQALIDAMRRQLNG